MSFIMFSNRGPPSPSLWQKQVSCIMGMVGRVRENNPLLCHGCRLVEASLKSPGYTVIEPVWLWDELGTAALRVCVCVCLRNKISGTHSPRVNARVSRGEVSPYLPVSPCLLVTHTHNLPHTQFPKQTRAQKHSAADTNKGTFCPPASSNTLDMLNYPGEAVQTQARGQTDGALWAENEDQPGLSLLTGDLSLSGGGISCVQHSYHQIHDKGSIKQFSPTVCVLTITQCYKTILHWGQLSVRLRIALEFPHQCPNHKNISLLLHLPSNRWSTAQNFFLAHKSPSAVKPFYDDD